MSKTKRPRMWTDQINTDERGSTPKPCAPPTPSPSIRAWPSQQAEWTSQLSPLNQRHLQERTDPHPEAHTTPPGRLLLRLLFIKRSLRPPFGPTPLAAPPLASCGQSWVPAQAALHTTISKAINSFTAGRQPTYFCFLAID